jgi:hypothetical protein
VKLRSMGGLHQNLPARRLLLPLTISRNCLPLVFVPIGSLRPTF